jgi:inner membrane protein
VDTLTHALSGALLARATNPKDASPHSPKYSLRRRIAAGFFACAAPDLDIVFAALGPVEYLQLHRGPTHSLLLLPFWALVFSWVLAKILREQRGWRALYGVTALGLALHIAGDLITSYGTMILWPLSDARPGIGSTFIIDPWFSGIIVVGLLLSLAFRKTRFPSVVMSIVLCGYVGFGWMQKQKALQFGAEYAASRDLTGATVAAHPRAVSPYNWTVFVSDAREHRFAHVNLVRAAPRTSEEGDGFFARLDAAFLPLSSARWQTRTRYGESAGETAAAAKEAWDSPAFGFMRWFADQPALEASTADPECYWFLDLRFVNPGRDWVPFRFGACRETPGAPWRVFERGEAGSRMALD